jgi:two-component system response regulator AlgR
MADGSGFLSGSAPLAAPGPFARTSPEAASAPASWRGATVAVADRTGPRQIALGQVRAITAERDYVRLHIGARSWLLRETMTSAAQRLAPFGFERIHRCALVNLALVRGRYRRADGTPCLLLEGGEEFAVGRKYAKAFAQGWSGRQG